MKDIYLYEGSNVLKNLLDIRDLTELENAEADYVSYRLKDIAKNLVTTTSPAGGLLKPLRGDVVFPPKGGLESNSLLLADRLKAVLLLLLRNVAFHPVALVLLRNILLDGLFIHISDGLAIIPARPEMPLIFLP